MAAYSLAAELKEAEDQWRATSPEWARKMRAYESWQANAKQRQKQKEHAAKQRPAEGDDPQDVAFDPSWEASFDPSEPSKDFSFAGGYVNVSKEDVDNEIASCAKWGLVDGRALAALKRGIGIHHSAMNKGYRMLVERYPSGDSKSNTCSPPPLQLVSSGVSARCSCYRYVIQLL